MAWLFSDLRIAIRGAGDLASGATYRLVKAGFPVIMLERPEPLFVRRTVCFGNAIFDDGHFTVEEIESVLASDQDDVENALSHGQIPILIDAEGKFLQTLKPSILIDARMQKNRLDTEIKAAPLVIALGPGYETGRDCHAVIETQRGHTLGRVIWQGSALADTGTPGKIAGYEAERVLRAPADGYVEPALGIEIGSQLKQGDLIATVNEMPIIAPFPGVLRGLIHPSVKVWTGLKIGDLDPRSEVQNCFTISDKALAIGGGVVEAVLSAPSIRDLLRKTIHAAV